MRICMQQQCTKGKEKELYIIVFLYLTGNKLVKFEAGFDKLKCVQLP